MNDDWTYYVDLAIPTIHLLVVGVVAWKVSSTIFTFYQQVGRAAFTNERVVADVITTAILVVTSVFLAGSYYFNEVSPFRG